ncbi:TIGR02678 family protein [Pradoshia eiseniae]|uniref:TIGR02678 family protein n=1 Tax=Pradoshia eiseniae TaxID=2064768 RepID=A0A2S7MXC0_9BACI|nr:TIGR02678 family protein [Pradoshia eiseniae]PQD94419.1 TIGR02678 family protein [Pradoshia eiseniae]
MSDKEQFRAGVTALLENFWIQKRTHPAEYMNIKRNQKAIQKYFVENFGYRLYAGIDLYKLEKIPYRTEKWMGIQGDTLGFKEPMDYSIFAAILAYLEDKAKDDLFLVSTLVENVKNFFDDQIEVRWENYQHRLSFCRAMKYAQAMDLVECLEGEIDKYKTDGKEEILYRPTMNSKYFMRYFSKPVQEFQNVNEMLEDSWKIPGEEPTARMNLQALNRRLFFSPVVYRHELTDEEKRYLSLQTHRMVENIPENTHFELEVYKNELLLVSKEKNLTGQQHPNLKTISDVVLQFSALLKAKVKELGDEQLPDFEYSIGKEVFEKWIEELQDEFGHGWSKNYREQEPVELAESVLDYLIDWKFADYDKQTYSVILYPPAVRIGGTFPRDYLFQRYFVRRIKEMGFFVEGDHYLSMDLFREIVDTFNKDNKDSKMTVKTSLDAIEKYVLSKDDDFIALDEEKIVTTKGA